MSLEVTGKLIKVLQEQSGEGKNGVWIKQEFVIETNDQYPKTICFNVWGDKTKMIKSLNIGEEIKVSFDPQSREYNERWYTDLRAWKIEQISKSANTANKTDPPPDLEDIPPIPEEDDLPF